MPTIWPWGGFGWPLQEHLHGFHQGSGFFRRADGDAQVVLHCRVAKPPDQDLPIAQLLKPRRGGVFRWVHQDEIGLAREDMKAEYVQLAAKLLTGCDDSAEVRPVVGQVVQRRQRGDLAQAVDVVAVADLVERGNKVRVADAI